MVGMIFQEKGSSLKGMRPRSRSNHWATQPFARDETVISRLGDSELLESDYFAVVELSAIEGMNLNSFST